MRYFDFAMRTLASAFHEPRGLWYHGCKEARNYGGNGVSFLTSF